MAAETPPPPPTSALDSLKSLTETVGKAWGVRTYRWEGILGHPRQFLSGIRGYLEDRGFTVVSEFADRPGSLRDVSYFEGAVVARQEAQRTDGLLALLGFLTIPLLVGFWITSRATRRQRVVVALVAEGETYWVGAKGVDSRPFIQADTQTVAERSGVVGDTRIVLRAATGTPDKKNEFEIAGRSRERLIDLPDVLEALARHIETRWPALRAGGVQPVATDLTSKPRDESPKPQRQQ